MIFTSIINKIGNDQKIAGKAHIADYFDLQLKPLPVSLLKLVGKVITVISLNPGHNFFETSETNLDQMLIQ